MFKHLPYNSFSQAQQQLAGIVAIDYFFAKEMVNALCSNLVNNKSEEITAINEPINLAFHLFIVLSESLRNGNSCLALDNIANSHFGLTNDGSIDGLPNEKQGFIFPNIHQLIELLSQLMITPEHEQALVFVHSNNESLALNSRLYLRRYYLFEQSLQQSMIARLSSTHTYSNQHIQHCIAQLFPEQKQKDESVEEETTEIDWQKVAVANAINKNFTVIAGGPGTGKTYTVTKLLAALLILEQTKREPTQEPLRIALVAPTGKAAQRLSESIINAVNGFKGDIADEILARIPNQAQTLHRLLGVIPNSPNFRHNQNNLLAVDVLLIDEVSMVDLAMMTRVFRALPAHAKVILLGDADQLPSVAAGSVLADIAPRPHGGFSDKNSQYLSEVMGFTHNINANKGSLACDHVTFLTKSRRFDGSGGIGLIASAVIAGNSKASWQLLENATHTNEYNQIQSTELTLHSTALEQWLTPLIKHYYKDLFCCKTVAEAFTLLAKFRVLCATRQGDLGVEGINAWVINYFTAQGLIPYASNMNSQALYHAQPIMISENNYSLGLYNGDIGLLWQNEAGHLMAVFETPNDNEQESFKWIIPSRLPSFETVYAMTIHKTQGSEFEHVAMILPEQSDNRLLSRELLYTGITRAKAKLTIASKEHVWKKGVERAVKRDSGLQLLPQN